MIKKEKKFKLISKAIEAFHNAYAPYSNFKVGSALLMKNGKIILGANIENCAYGSSNCAERSALFSAYSQGYIKEDILMIAVVTDTPKASTPCGVCRQVIAELMDKYCPIILSNLDQLDIRETNIKKLLPDSFVLS
ncbi:cytidine deaminase [Francisella halioticida]|uniref:Cytidine deaminase n=1 Tax=Francisella halioticida TaxID=549298 RepID=A0ABM6LZ29_9GAMM|nr:cytidine deaminase [Francisella halioticida]ASG67844.1 cytidine deaminase [Francisella halioticida]BCD90676.1 cytidine deaminase [Francisella halioticida]